MNKTYPGVGGGKGSRPLPLDFFQHSFLNHIIPFRFV
jgi:hypothetical protein